MAWPSLLKVKGGRPSKRLPLLFECVLCSNKFTVDDVASKQYYVKTLICKACYKKAQHTNPQVWCFSKIQTSKTPGYSPENVSCRLLCPDRTICMTFLKAEGLLNDKPVGSRKDKATKKINRS